MRTFVEWKVGIQTCISLLFHHVPFESYIISKKRSDAQEFGRRGPILESTKLSNGEWWNKSEIHVCTLTFHSPKVCNNKVCLVRNRCRDIQVLTKLHDFSSACLCDLNTGQRDEIHTYYINWLWCQTESWCPDLQFLPFQPSSFESYVDSYQCSYSPHIMRRGRLL
jgi:hypothetical protein